MATNIDRHRSTSLSDEFYDLDNAFDESRRMTAVVDRIRSPVDNRRPVVTACKLYNATGGAVACGIGPEIDLPRWRAGQWDDGAVGDDYSDDSDDAKDAGTSDFQLNLTGTNNDGHVILCADLWSACEYVIGTAGGASVDEYTYWNGAWVALTTLNEPDFTATGTDHLLFEPPEDWLLTTAIAPGEGIPAGYYAVRMRSTTNPPMTSALATTLRIGHPLHLGFFNVPASGRASYEGAKRGGMCRDGEGLWACFGTHASGNHVQIAGEDYLA